MTHHDPSYNRWILAILRWFDSEYSIETIDTQNEKKVDWIRILPLILLHAGCLGVFVVGWSWI